MSLNEFRSQLAQLYSINKDHLYCVKPWQNDVNLEIIPYLKWESYTTTDLDDTKTLSSTFWGLRDGDLILCKDGQVEDNISKSMEQQTPANIATSNMGYPYRQVSYQVKERALKIHTPNYDQREKKEQTENSDKIG